MIKRAIIVADAILSGIYYMILLPIRIPATSQAPKRPRTVNVLP